MARRATDLPDPGVRLGPDVTDEVSNGSEPVAELAVDPVSRVGVQPRHLHHVTVDIQLHLFSRRVAHSDRTRAHVSLERERPLGCVRRPVHPVQHLHPRMGDLRRMHQPPEERLRFVRAPETEQGAHHECRVAEPGEPVVPVALATDLFGERGRRRRRDGSAPALHQELQREPAPQDLVVPWAGGLPLGGPRSPGCDRPLESSLHVTPRWEHQRLLIGDRESDERGRARHRSEGCGHRPRLEMRSAGVPGADGYGPPSPGRHRDAGPKTDRPVLGAIAEPRVDRPSEPNGSRDPLDATCQLSERDEAVADRQRQRVGDPGDAILGDEGRLQDIRLRHISSPRLERRSRRELESPAAASVQQ